MFRELERVSREAAQAVGDLQSLRNSVVRSSVSTSRALLGSPLRKSNGDARSAPKLNPSSSPAKDKSARSVDRSASLEMSGKDRSSRYLVIQEVDEVISHYKSCCTSLAKSISISVERGDDDLEVSFKVQHILADDSDK